MANTKPNWLLRILVLFSLGFHAMVFGRISEVYMAHNLTCIELTLEDISDPTTRIIPRPRHRQKMPPSPLDVKKITYTRRLNNPVKPIPMKPVKVDSPNSIGESIAGVAVSGLNETGLAQWNPKLEPFVEYDTVGSYLEMVKLRIEREKKYPESAMSRQLEGHITIQFIIAQNGDVVSVEIEKQSPHDCLNKAAIAAVENAAPFQKPPSRFFKGNITLTVTIAFELT
jgi:protein TonB